MKTFPYLTAKSALNALEVFPDFVISSDDKSYYVGPAAEATGFILDKEDLESKYMDYSEHGASHATCVKCVESYIAFYFGKTPS